MSTGWRWCSCIVSIIVNDAQQDATILAYLFVPNQLYVFRAMSSPIIRSNWLYLQHLILSTGIAAGWCHGWDVTHFVGHHLQTYQMFVSHNKSGNTTLERLGMRNLERHKRTNLKTCFHSFYIKMQNSASTWYLYQENRQIALAFRNRASSI